jgi:AcrR family transcriptional regulator
LARELTGFTPSRDRHSGVCTRINAMQLECRSKIEDWFVEQRGLAAPIKVRNRFVAGRNHARIAIVKVSRSLRPKIMPTAKSPASGPKIRRTGKTKMLSSSDGVSGRSREKPIRTGNTRDPESTSAAILVAAVKEFTERGYEGARVDNIADRASINKRMLYHYFGNKQALYVAVLESSYAAIRSAEHGLHLSDRDPIEGMTDLVLFTWRYYLAHPEFLSLLNTENLHRAKFLKRSARIFELNSPLIERISVLLRRGVEQGVFRDDMDPLKVYVSIAALGFFYLSNRWTLSTVFRRDLLAKEEVESWGRHMVDVTLSYLRRV